MSEYFVTGETLGRILSESRRKAHKTQKFMAIALHRSLPTIQNWESGYSTIDVIEFMEWFKILGVNPLRHILELLAPQNYINISHDISDQRVNNSLDYYFTNVATIDEKRKLAYCIFGETGSSWRSQLNMLTAHNKCSLRTRVNVARTISDSYKIEQAEGKLVGHDSVIPDMENLDLAIQAGMNATLNGSSSYMTERIKRE